LLDCKAATFSEYVPQLQLFSGSPRKETAGVILVLFCHWAGFSEQCISMRDAVKRICFILYGGYSEIVQIDGI
jgi:hypothetical protein